MPDPLITPDVKITHHGYECVPLVAYNDLAAEARVAAWEALTRIAKDHRYCDCTGSFPCEVRQVVDQFGREFCKPKAEYHQVRDHVAEDLDDGGQ